VRKALGIVILALAALGLTGTADAGSSPKKSINSSKAAKAFRASSVGKKLIKAAKKKNCKVVKALGW
jgi:hypothetical protein